ncbi:hypothetical protein AB5J56_44700 [Streptomyces sp. R21]|uniref:PknH-like extracellular domain-containing protein n=1 Tax=Streptomyces sp. R21 TaxID=3238627 RepID=A0AB39PQV6_9ACTN
MAAALPEQGALPGYSVNNSAPETTTGGDKSDQSVRPAACQPLEDARSGVFADSAATAWIHISASKFAPPDETLTFTSYRSGAAGAHLASLDKALAACPSLSFQNRYGDRVSVDVERVKDEVSAGDASVSFRMHWTLNIDGFKSDTYDLVTTVRSGEATITVVSDSIVGSQLSDAKKRAFLPKLDQQLLKRQADALGAAQHN